MQSDGLRRKVLSTLLSASMVLSLVPAQALAEELEAVDDVPDEVLELVLKDEEFVEEDEALVAEEPLEDEADELDADASDDLEELDVLDESDDLAEAPEEADSLVPLSEDEAGTLVPMASNTKASDAIKSLKNQDGFKSGASYGKSGCWRFVNAVCQKLYGENAPGGTSGYKLTNPGNYPLVGQVVAPSLDATKQLLLKGYPGDIVQLKGGSGGYVSYQHTFILESVSDSGLTIWEHLDSTGVRTTTYTWSQFYSNYAKFSSSASSQGISLYHYKNYSSKYPDTTAPSDIVVTPNSNTVTNIEQRWYSLRPKGNKHKALDIDGGSTVNGGNLQVYDWNRTKSQLFDISSSGVNGSYNIVPIPAYEAGTTRYITVQYASLNSGENVFQWEGNGSNSQRWYIEKNSDGTYSFRNIRSGLYLDIYYGKLDNGTNVRQDKGNGANAQRFYLVSANAAIWKVNLSASEFTYTGKEIDPGLKAYATPSSPDYQLEKDIDYSLSLSNNVNVGTATWTVNGLAGNPTKQSGTFKIVPASINSASVSSISKQTKTGSALTPKPTITFNGTTLKEGTDYTLSYSNNTNAGTAKIEITGKGNFTGVRTVSFEIVNPQPKTKDISKATVSSIGNQAYTGKALKPSVTVKDGSATLKEGTDYTLSYKNNTKVGTATVTVTGKGSYTGTKTATFKITAASISKATVSKIGEQKWTGKSVTPKPTVKLGGKTLVEGTDYSLAYSSNINPGKATVTISGTGNYSGKVTATFTIGAKTGEWKKSGKRWWYSWNDGTYPAGEFVVIDGKTYYFDGSGWMLTGWQKIAGNWYWFASSGAMGTGWTKVSGKWYWLGTTGKMATGWLDESGSRYYLASSGAMLTGWQKISGKWYWFASSGAMGRSRWVDSYYVGKDGVMLTNTVTPDGYRVGADGKWDGKGKVTA